ncbi:LINE-1 retrotransposable element ORF1 protein [Plecturocebus cupreus]
MTEKRVKRNEQSLQEIWDYVKRPNLRLIGVPECDEENESKLENTLQDIIQENFPNLARQANIQVQEIQRTPQRYSSRRATPRHIIVGFTRVEMKEKMLRAAREKGRVTHKGKPIRLTADLSAETLQARRQWGPMFNILKEKNFQPRISYLAKLSFISEGKINFFVKKQVLRDYITTRPALRELLKEALHMDRNNQYQPFQKHTKSLPEYWDYRQEPPCPANSFSLYHLSDADDILPHIANYQFADTAGQERYRTITTAYYRGAMGFILMYDITNEESFNAVQDWATQIKTYSWDNAQVILVGNKCDMEEERVVPTEKGRLLAEQLGFDFFEASAKENISVRQAFERLVDAICDKMSDSMDTDPSMLGSSKNTHLSDTPPLLQQNCSC